MCCVRHLDDDDLDAIGVLFEERILQELRTMKGQIMAALADVLADETAEGGEITNLVNAFHAQSDQITALQAQIAALAPGTLTAEQQATIDQIFAQAEQNKATVSAVLNPTSTPAPPATPPADTTPPADGSTPPADGSTPPVG